MKLVLKSLTCVALAVGVLSGCANMSETQQGTAKGAGIGAVAGAVLGLGQDEDPFACAMLPGALPAGVYAFGVRPPQCDGRSWLFARR